MCRLWKGRLLSTTTEQWRNDAAGPTKWTHLKHRRPSGPANSGRRLLCVQINFLTSLLKTVLMCVWPGRVSPADSARTVVSSVTRTQCCVTSPPDVPPRSYSSTFHRISSISPLMWICLRTRHLISRNGQSCAHGTARCIFLKMYFFIFLINYFCLWPFSSCGTVKIVKSALMLCNLLHTVQCEFNTKKKHKLTKNKCLILKRH